MQNPKLRSDIEHLHKEKKMGRPLNKKYFGNRNAGTAVTGDDGLGGNQVASVNVTTAGTYTTKPVITFSAPDKSAIGGVTALTTAANTFMKAVSATVGAPGGAGNAYVVGDILTVTLSTGVSTFTVATIDGGGGIATVTVLDGGTHTGVLLTGLKPTTVIHGDGTASAAVAGTLSLVYGLKAVTLTNNGSGYTDPADAGVIVTGANTGVAAVAASVMGTSTIVGNNENAINISAWIPTANGGSSSVAGDIVKQVSGSRYKVETAQGTGIVKLVAAAPAAGQATIVATDFASATYYVTKLTGHKATLTRFGGGAYEFADGAAVAWTFAAATTLKNVTISNT